MVKDNPSVDFVFHVLYTCGINDMVVKVAAIRPKTS